MLNLIDEFARECLAIRGGRSLRSTDVIDVLSDQFLLPGVPSHMRSGNGPEFTARAVRNWIAAVGAEGPVSSLSHLGRTDTARVSPRFEPPLFTVE